MAEVEFEAEPLVQAPVRQRLRDALTTAMRGRERVAVSALRATLAAIDNAEAVERPTATDRGLAIEQSPVGAGAAEVARRELNEAQIQQIVRDEVAERLTAADGYERAGHAERGARLREEADVIVRCLGVDAYSQVDELD